MQRRKLRDTKKKVRHEKKVRHLRHKHEELKNKCACEERSEEYSKCVSKCNRARKTLKHEARSELSKKIKCSEHPNAERCREKRTQVRSNLVNIISSLNLDEVHPARSHPVKAAPVAESPYGVAPAPVVEAPVEESPVESTPAEGPYASN